MARTMADTASEGAAAHGIEAVVAGWGHGHADFAGARMPVPDTAVTHVATVPELRRALGV